MFIHYIIRSRKENCSHDYRYKYWEQYYVRFGFSNDSGKAKKT
jgi:hypothetical protein